MAVQLNIFDQPVHLHENNVESMENLAASYERLSKQCKKVFDLLMNGKSLTTESALVVYKVFSLPRRILDLKQKRVKISDRWDDKVKVWWMTEADRSYNQRFKSKT